jgi:hypothetical protein
MKRAVLWAPDDIGPPRLGALGHGRSSKETAFILPRKGGGEKIRGEEKTLHP